MKLPKQFMIKGETWLVSKSDELDELDLWGQADRDNRTITLNAGLNDKQMEFTMIHEFIHASLHELHVDLEEGVEEVIADGLAKCFLDSFRLRAR